jgi:starvation-inducible DNA-binding protein
MIKTLYEGHLIAAKTLRQAIEVADDADDDVTEDMLIQRLGAHDKMAWMLGALLKK